MFEGHDEAQARAASTPVREVKVTARAGLVQKRPTGSISELAQIAEGIQPVTPHGAGQFERSSMKAPAIATVLAWRRSLDSIFHFSYNRRQQLEGLPRSWKRPPHSERPRTGGVGGRALVNGQEIPGREGGHRLQAPHSSHPPKVAWELIGREPDRRLASVDQSGIARYRV